MAPVKEGDIVGELMITRAGITPDKKIPVAAPRKAGQPAGR